MRFADTSHSIWPLCWWVAIILIASAMMIPAEGYAAKDAYTELLTQGVDQIDAGQYNAAVEALDQALILRPCETTGRLAMGLLLLHTRKVDAAIEEYNYILSVDPENAQAAYGLAVCRLAQGRIDEAHGLFEQAAKWTDGGNAAGALAYVAMLRGQTASSEHPAQDPAEILTRAEILRKQGRLDDAEPMFVELSRLASITGYDEDHGAIMTLDARSPIALNADGITRLPRMRISSRKTLLRASGQIGLRPDAKLGGAQYVVIRVDGSLAGMINSEPYQYTWDTSNLCNGIHTVKMLAQNEDGDTVAESTRTYWVQNEKPGKEQQFDSPEAARVLETLWRRVRIKPSIKLACYYAGSYYTARGNMREATPFLEKAAACDPDYADVRALLQQCYGRKGFQRFSGKQPGAGKALAITFDDGPNPSTQSLLDILDREGVKATFFMVGSQVKSNPSIVRTMADEGHEIEGHTFSHRNLLQLQEKEVERELLRSAAAIRDATGKESALFRPPGGHLSAAGEAAAANYGFTGIYWTLLCSSFETSGPERMTEYVTSSIHDGAIVLMHNGERVTLKALPAIISDLKAKGYTFVTLSELMGRH